MSASSKPTRPPRLRDRGAHASAEPPQCGAAGEPVVDGSALEYRVRHIGVLDAGDTPQLALTARTLQERQRPLQERGTIEAIRRRHRGRLRRRCRQRQRRGTLAIPAAGLVVGSVVVVVVVGLEQLDPVMTSLRRSSGRARFMSSAKRPSGSSPTTARAHHISLGCLTVGAPTPSATPR